jgi:hypothetical protein
MGGWFFQIPSKRLDNLSRRTKEESVHEVGWCNRGFKFWISLDHFDANLQNENQTQEHSQDKVMKHRK